MRFQPPQKLVPALVLCVAVLGGCVALLSKHVAASWSLIPSHTSVISPPGSGSLPLVPGKTVKEEFTPPPGALRSLSVYFLSSPLEAGRSATVSIRNSAGVLLAAAEASDSQLAGGDYEESVDIDQTRFRQTYSLEVELHGPSGVPGSRVTAILSYDPASRLPGTRLLVSGSPIAGTLALRGTYLVGPLDFLSTYPRLLGSGLGEPLLTVAGLAQAIWLIALLASLVLAIGLLWTSPSPAPPPTANPSSSRRARRRSRRPAS